MEPTEAQGPDSAAENPSPGGTPTHDEKLMATIAHAGGAVGLVVPGASIIAPFIVYMTQKGPFVRTHAVEALNLQITLFGIYLAITVINLATCMLGGFGLGVALFWVASIAATVLNVLAALQAHEGRPYTYPVPIWRVIK